jgi:hypothetical protein
MGSWNETDTVTHAPVFPGDEVVMLVYAPDRGRGTEFFSRDFELIAKGKYNDYGWLEKTPGQWSDGMKLRAKGLDEPYERALFVHKKTWDTILIASPKKLRKLADQAEFVLNFCSRNRINPEAALAFKGMQHANLKEYKALIALMDARAAAWELRESEERDE